MTIDERLERLTERHEALTQSVESLHATAKLHDRQIGEIMEAAARLLHIAELHQHRLDSHENRLDNLEDNN